MLQFETCQKALLMIRYNLCCATTNITRIGLMCTLQQKIIPFVFLDCCDSICTNHKPTISYCTKHQIFVTSGSFQQIQTCTCTIWWWYQWIWHQFNDFIIVYSPGCSLTLYSISINAILSSNVYHHSTHDMIRLNSDCFQSI